MTRVILQPAGSGDAARHYQDTVRQPVSLARIHPLLPATESARLGELYPLGVVPFWGVKPGKNEVNKRKWDRVQRGDIVLFAGDKKIFSSAVVTHKLHNQPLAVELWGWDKPEGKETQQTWEYVYCLDEVTQRSIPYAGLAAVAGYQPNVVVQGFNVLDDKKSGRLVSAFDLASPTTFAPVTKEQFQHAVATLDGLGPLDAQREALVRIEQGYLRGHLFGKEQTSECAICGRLLPVELLVAAHVKKRAECSDAEKRDLNNVVPMCKLGCDELFERGYIAVLAGKVQGNQARLKRITDPMVRTSVAALLGRDCSWWKPQNKGYFGWHQQRHG